MRCEFCNEDFESKEALIKHLEKKLDDLNFQYANAQSEIEHGNYVINELDEKMDNIEFVLKKLKKEAKKWTL